MIEGRLLMQLVSKIADSNRKYTCSKGVKINNLKKDTTTQQHSPDEQQIALFLS